MNNLDNICISKNSDISSRVPKYHDVPEFSILNRNIRFEEFHPLPYFNVPLTSGHQNKLIEGIRNIYSVTSDNMKNQTASFPDDTNKIQTFIPEVLSLSSTVTDETNQIPMSYIQGINSHNRLASLKNQYLNQTPAIITPPPAHSYNISNQSQDNQGCFQIQQRFNSHIREALLQNRYSNQTPAIITPLPAHSCNIPAQPHSYLVNFTAPQVINSQIRGVTLRNHFPNPNPAFINQSAVISYNNSIQTHASNVNYPVSQMINSSIRSIPLQNQYENANLTFNTQSPAISHSNSAQIRTNKANYTITQGASNAHDYWPRFITPLTQSRSLVANIGTSTDHLSGLLSNGYNLQTRQQIMPNHSQALKASALNQTSSNATNGGFVIRTITSGTTINAQQQTYQPMKLNHCDPHTNTQIPSSQTAKRALDVSNCPATIGARKGNITSSTKKRTLNKRVRFDLKELRVLPVSEECDKYCLMLSKFFELHEQDLPKLETVFDHFLPPNYMLTLLLQPDEQYRNSCCYHMVRNPVKDITGNGFPTLRLLGWRGPGILQIFTVARTGCAVPHKFYQTTLTSTKEMNIFRLRHYNMTSVIEMPFISCNEDYNISVNFLGIIKPKISGEQFLLTNNSTQSRADTSKNCGEMTVNRRNPEKDSILEDTGDSCCLSKCKGTNIRLPSTDVRLAFRVFLLEGEEKLFNVLQVVSDPIRCGTWGFRPEVRKLSTKQAPETGNVELTILGWNFSQEIGVLFQEPTRDLQPSMPLWKRHAQLDVKNTSRTHVMCIVPQYDGIFAPLKRPLEVYIILETLTKYSEPEIFTYIPAIFST